MDSKASRERSSSTQTGLLQSQPSPRHYGNPLLVRVTAEETVGVRFRRPAAVPYVCVNCVVWAARELVPCVSACLACDVLCRTRCWAFADSWHVTCNEQDLKRKVRGALEEQYRKRKDAESNEPSIADWALWKFANSPPEELTDDSKFPISSDIHPRSLENHLTLPVCAHLACAAQNLDAAKCTDSDCYIGVEHPDKHRYVRCSPPFTSLLFRFLCP